MVERNAQGKRARLYFIACERRALASAQAMPAMDPAKLGGIVKLAVNKALEGRDRVMAARQSAQDDPCSRYFA